jgi:hypothetical protein
MGKSHRAQGEALVRPTDKTRIQTQVTANDEENSFDTPIFKDSEPAGESDTVPTFTPFIKRYQPPTWFMVAKYRLGLETQRAAGILSPPTGYGAQDTILGLPSPVDALPVGLDLILVWTRRPTAKPRDANPHILLRFASREFVIADAQGVSLELRGVPPQPVEPVICAPLLGENVDHKVTVV